MELINYIFNKQDESPVDELIRAYFKTYMIEKESGKTRAIVVANYNTPLGNFLFEIVVENTKKKWKAASKRQLLSGLGEQAYEKFGIKNIETNKVKKGITISNLFGFMTAFSSHQQKGKLKEIVFKTKSLEKSSKGRTLGGQVCSRGQYKVDIIKNINSLLPKKNGGKKYQLSHIHSRTIEQIYTHDDIKQIVTDETRTHKIKNKDGKTVIKSEVKLNTLQLCIELELIFRYYNHIKEDDKLWFFSTVYDSINNIEKLSR